MRIGVLGGGISGLSIAYYLARLAKSSGKDVRIDLYEASNRVGGWIRSEQVQLPGGGRVLFEHGPRTLRPKGVEGYACLELVKELGLLDSVIPVSVSASAAKNRFLVNDNGKGIYRLPSTALELCREALRLRRVEGRIDPKLARSAVYHVAKDLLSFLYAAPHRQRIDGAKVRSSLLESGVHGESINEFFTRIMGPAVSKELVQAIVAGIYAGSVDELELASCFPAFALSDALRGKGSFFLQMLQTQVVNQGQRNDASLQEFQQKNSVYTLEGGLEQLPRAILTNLGAMDNVTIHLNKACTKIAVADTDKLALYSDQSRAEIYDHVVAAVPAQALATCITKFGKLAEELSTIEAATVYVLNYALAKSFPKEKIDGFGYLVSSGRSPVLGCVFDSSVRPNPDCHAITVMLGGYKTLKVDCDLTESLQEIANKHVFQDQLQIDKGCSILASNFSVAKKCIPQFKVGHFSKVARIEQMASYYPLTLHHASYENVGINNLVYSAKEKAKVILGLRDSPAPE